MGTAFGCQVSVDNQPFVKLNIYDVGGHELMQGANNLLRAVGTGAFHAGVEIYGQEWSFGFCEGGTGVFCVQPGFCPPHTFRETLHMGETQLSAEQVDAVIKKLKAQWHGEDYDLLRRNCCHFSETLCRELRVTPVPAWVTNLAGAGATLEHGAQQAYVMAGQGFDRARNTAIIAAAKAGELDLQYDVRGTVRAKARDVLVGAGELDARYGISQRASSMAQEAAARAPQIFNQVQSAVATGAATAHARALELDRQHNLSQKASQAAGQAASQAQRLGGHVAGHVSAAFSSAGPGGAGGAGGGGFRALPPR